MRWIAILAVSLVLTGSVLAAGSDEQYLDIYNEILQADSLLQSDHAESAAHRYLQAQIDLQKLQTEHPSWNPDIVKFRIDYLADKLQALGKYLPASNAPPVAATAPAQSGGVVQPAAAAGPAIAALEQRNAGLQEQVRSLNSANAELEGKLKEALSVQPAAVSPAELTKAEERIVALQKERDLLAVALEQEKSSNASAIAAAKAAAVDQAVAEVKAHDAAELQRAQEEVAKFKAAAAESERKLAAATKELEALKEARALEADQNAALKARTDAEAQKSQEEVARLKEAGEESAKILAAARKELETLKAKHPTDLEIAEDGKQILEERDQLKQSLAQISKDEEEITRLKGAVAEAEKKLAAANSELDSLKAERSAETQATADTAKAVTEERDKLKAELAQRSKDLADAEAHHNEELLTVRTALQQAEQRRDELEKKLAAASQAQPAVPPPTTPEPVSAAPTATPPEAPAAPAPAATATTAPETPAVPPPTTSGTPVPATAPETPSAPAPTATAPEPVPEPAPVAASASAQPADAQSTLKMEQLQARVAVLEAKPVPYTPEELALLKMSPATTPAELPQPVLRPGHVHSNKDLPPGSGALWAEALRASMAGDFDTAEMKYKEVLEQDETNVYVLAFLANAQFAAGHLANCEKSVKQALAVDPEDPGSLYLLGLLRYRQDRLDEALDALSLSAKINPTNAATQNFLGCVLADKGLRPAAETALRKALQSDPDYADAHFNLAVVYADNQPPSWELARWHYKKAVALGHAKSPTLDKLLGENQ